MAPDETAAPSSSPSRPAPSASASHCIIAPAEQSVPLVFASPHSGDEYPAEFVASSRLDPLTLRRSEDAFVDRLYGGVADFGAPLLKALFPRVYIDPNREPFEFDPAMFEDALPEYVNRGSPRVAAGLGTIARVVANGEEVYAGKLTLGEAIRRVERYYFPYHQALKHLLDTTIEHFGCYLLIDCHSMPSIGGPMDADPGSKRVDFVLGDCYGTACAPQLTTLVDKTLSGLGFSVRRNTPYAGGYTTRHYGRPREDRHALQIEINRALYMDEERVRPNDGFPHVVSKLAHLFSVLATIDGRMLRG